MRKKTRQDSWEATANEREVLQRRHLSQFGQYHYEWLQEIGRRWKERGEFALDRFSLMDYYKRKDDAEVAAYVSLLTSQNARLYDQITELRNLIGPKPSEWVKERGFITLSSPRVMNERIIGTARVKADLFNLLDWLWQKRNGDADRPVGNIVKIQDERYALDMLAVRLMKHDGIGRGIYPEPDGGLACPMNEDMLRVVRCFYPSTSRRHGLKVTQENADDVLSFIGYDDTVDFIYTYQGYCRMMELMPEAMTRNEKYFSRRFLAGWQMDEKRHFTQVQKDLLVQIRFD